MTPTEFRASLDLMHMSQTAFARALGCNARTVRRWALGQTPVPSEVALILRLLAEVQRVGGVVAVQRALQA